MKEAAEMKKDDIASGEGQTLVLSVSELKKCISNMEDGTMLTITIEQGPEKGAADG